EGALAIRQCSGAAGGDPTGVALFLVPERERLGGVVLNAHQKSPHLPPENDFGLWAPTSPRLFAPRARPAPARGCRPPSGALKGGHGQGTPLTVSALVRSL